jgi:hypothetical protein
MERLKMLEKLKSKIKSWVANAEIRRLQKQLKAKTKQELTTKARLDTLIVLCESLFKIWFFGNKITESDIRNILAKFNDIKDR